MNDGLVKQRIYRIISGVFAVPLDSIDDTTGQDDIESWDSLAHIHFIVALEAEFAVSFTPEQALEMTSVPSIWKVLRETSATNA